MDRALIYAYTFVREAMPAGWRIRITESPTTWSYHVTVYRDRGDGEPATGSAYVCGSLYRLDVQAGKPWQLRDFANRMRRALDAVREI